MRKADTNEVPENCNTIFIRNLPYDSTEEEVGNIFKPCGEISSIRFVYNSNLNHFKGFCYIQFTDNSSVRNALNLNGKEIKSRKMIVDFEESGPKMGYKFRTDVSSKFNKEYNEIQSKTLNKKRKRKNDN